MNEREYKKWGNKRSVGFIKYFAGKICIMLSLLALAETIHLAFSKSTYVFINLGQRIGFLIISIITIIIDWIVNEKKYRNYKKNLS